VSSTVCAISHVCDKKNLGSTPLGEEHYNTHVKSNKTALVIYVS